MGMVANLYAVDERQVGVLHNDPMQLFTLDADTLTLDKAWHGIHYLLTGSVWEGDAPLDFLLHGGEPLAEEEDDPVPRLLDPNELRQTDAALAQVDADMLRRRYDPHAMRQQGVYPDIWDEGEAALTYCLQHVELLKAFVARTARQDRSMVIFIG